ncbi:MAG: glycosyltransferase [Rhodoferax sp.]|uniref:glycosyltransferase n=1 Tax=Rhodoferax sp. TaxID=50421 RepID=UPI0026247E88|nr:glycosyltransferase [Rhodoferax sp.]MDD2882993.1 glycosyltransferase [Rhodoferax sp.]
MKDLLQWLDQKQSLSTSRSVFLPMRQRLLYAVNHSYPFSSNGYAVRTHGVARALVRSGVEVIAASRPGLPWDKVGFNDQGFALSHVIDGVRYIHSPVPSRQDGSLEDYLSRAVAVYAELIRVFKPAAVMAASNWHNALPVAIAARETGLPFWYEVRGFWEISQAARDPGWENSVAYEHEVAGEVSVVKAAERVFTLNRLMRDELVRRGVEAERIELVPNGFPGWAASPKVDLTRADVGIQAHYVVGYVGSFNIYEGLETLIEALAILRRHGVDVVLLLVGSGEPSGFGAGQSETCSTTVEYRRLAEQLGVSEFVFMPGRVAPDLAEAYYALLDVVALPRRPLAVCELVSPMKPLEAAAHGKRVLMSDVAPLADLAGLCPNFSYFAKGDVNSLANKLGELLAAGDFAPQRCEALAGLTWEKNVTPMVAAIRGSAHHEMLCMKLAKEQ